MGCIVDEELRNQLIDYLSGFATQKRIQTFERALENRTRYFCVGLENIFQLHNPSAVLRSMDCFGIQDAHIIEDEYEYRVNPDVALGASKWLTLIRYNTRAHNTYEAISSLRSRGYRIVATTPHSFKGYESEVVVIPCVDNYVAPEGKVLENSLYVAMTRARSLLAIYGLNRGSEASRMIGDTIGTCISIQNTQPILQDMSEE